MMNKTNGTMPVLFIGHGNPMNAIQDTPFTAAWEAEAGRIPLPAAILCISAHWETDGPRVTSDPAPRTIHDFYGFPDDLFRVQYPAPGSPALAERIRTLAGKEGVTPDGSWGLDHGTWAVVRRMYPGADIPVVQLSLDRGRSPERHAELARTLLPLRDEGVLIIGSGNVVHNLPLLQWDATKPYRWAEEFDRLATGLVLAGDLERLCGYRQLGEAALLSIPTSEHYLPLVYALALKVPGEPVSCFVEGIVLGSVSMRAFRIG